MERRRKIKSGEGQKPQPAGPPLEPDPWGLRGDDDVVAVRKGDRLSITFTGAKVQIAPYTTVEIDSATYERTLEPGDDLEHEWRRCYGYLKRHALAEARLKLAAFADEVATAKRRAGS